VFFQKHPHFWAKNGEICIFGLKTRAQNRKIEPKIIQKSSKFAQISMNWRQKQREKKVEFPPLNGLLLKYIMPTCPEGLAELSIFLSTYAFTG
jgi:hypothetical protein